jgi:hypothetical protein
MGIHLNFELTPEASEKVNQENYPVLINKIAKYVSENIESFLKNDDELKEIFLQARAKFPGRRGSKEVEFEKFTKKYKDWRQLVSKLLPAIEKQIRWMEQLAEKKKSDRTIFIPSWKNFITWLNNRSWEDELPGYSEVKKPIAYMPVMDQNMAMEFGKDVPIAKVPIYEPKPGMWRLDDPRLKDLPIKELVKI